MEQLLPRNIEGFEELEWDQNSSRQKDRKRQSNLYFQIPQAKPLLSKHYIDYSKPKVLIRQIKTTKECNELTAAPFVFTPFPTDKPLFQHPHQQKSGQLTLWKRFILSNNYKCLYIKYYVGPMEDFDRKTNKKLKHELTKLTQNNENLFATYIVDMNFLSEIGTYAIRQLEECTVKNDEAYLQQMDVDVQFDSRFQSGNLMYVFAKNDGPSEGLLREYYLVLQNDINTRGFANWFYFRLSSKKAGKFRFHIVNMQKSYSFFAFGMRPTIFSVQEYRRGKGQWHNEGYNISYHRNEMLKSEQNGLKYNTLSFTVQQSRDNDVMYLAAAIPYSYSRLVSYLDRIEKTAKLNGNIHFRKEGLALSISSNECPLLTITWKRDKKKEEVKQRKKIILVLARQHPSEIVSSFVMEGFINQLVQAEDERYADLLRRYIFKIVPMVNVDGVIYGNSRCDVSGADGNRKWSKNPNCFLYPVIAAIKKLVSNLMFDGYEVEYFLDLHGHSRKLGAFVYGCKGPDEVESRMLAYIMSKISKHFSFQQCKFGVSNYRKETARGCMNAVLNNHKSMTLQTSFYGYRVGTTIKPFQTKDLHEIGMSLLEAVNIDVFRNSRTINWANVGAQIKQTIIKSFIKEQDQQQQSGSDSNPEIDQMPEQEKAATFLNPATVAKIGLKEVKEVKVVERTKKQAQSQKILLFDFQQNVDNANNNNFNEISLSQRYLHSQMLSAIQRPAMIREVKSVTKIQPFKFRSLQRKQSQQMGGRKIRIAIDIQRVESKDRKIASPTLPKVNTRGSKQFWSHLKKQYETLVHEKQNMIRALPPASKVNFRRSQRLLKDLY